MGGRGVSERRGSTRIVTAGLVALALVLAVVGCQHPDAVLAGRLTVAGSGAHPAGVPVTVYADATETVVARTVTDAQGDYDLLASELPAGTYRIRFSTAHWWDAAADWATATPVAVTGAGRVTVDATLVPDVGIVSGTVTDAGGAVTGATVTLLSATTGTTVATATTGGDGGYSVAVPVAPYVVRAAAPGRTTRYHPAAATRAEAAVVEVGSAGATAAVALAAQSTITGVVTDGTAGVGGIVVAAYDRTSGQTVVGTTTAADGSFTLAGLDARAYGLGAHDLSGALPSRIVGAPDGVVAGATPFRPPAGGALDAGVIALVEDAAVYVSAEGDLASSDCTRTDPCTIIDWAISVAQVKGIHTVNVATGGYSTEYGPIQLASYIALVGGWRSDFTGLDPTGTTTIANSLPWAPVSAEDVAGAGISGVTVEGGGGDGGTGLPAVGVDGSHDIAIGAASGAPTALVGSDGSDATGLLVTGGSTVTVTATTVDSGSTAGAGSSAYGVRALSGSTVTLVDSHVTARAGNPGASAPTAAPPQATSGCVGADGGNATGPSSPGAGGAGGSCTTNPGGVGGAGGAYSGVGGGGDEGAGDAAGRGGFGGCGSLFGCGTEPTGGWEAGPGEPGGSGGAGTATPTATATWNPGTGGAGSVGSPGSGGGGGGGGKTASASGGGGGGGGGGGQGGAPGTVGGSGGGGSFGIYAVDATIDVRSTTVTAATGGVGGTGGPGGRGGAGGDGGAGGTRSCCLAGGGAGGGAGGAGGGGGGAGGGAGGPSIALLHIGSGTLTTDDAELSTAASPAAGGPGGTGGPAAPSGVGGDGTQGGVDGGSGVIGYAGATGQTGQGGLLLTVWDDGATS